MVQLYFFLRFRSQLRRTRPALTASLEETVSAAVTAAGGRLSDNRRFLDASFDSGRIGFWLDMLILVEKVQKALEKAGPALSGHALVIDERVPEGEAERLCRFLSSSAAATSTGIWCGKIARDVLQYACLFGKPFRGYGEFSEFKSYESGADDFFPHRERIMQALAANSGGNVLLLGPPLMGIRDAVYRYCAALTETPLVIRFNQAEPFADSLTPAVKKMIGASGNEAGELDTLGRLLSRERLRTQVSPFIAETAKRFLALLLGAYAASAKKRNSPAVVVLEEPLAYDEYARRIWRELFTSLDIKDELFVIGINSGDSGDSSEWGNVFPRTLKFQDTDFPAANRDSLKLPKDLWELLYAVALLGRFFPPFLFPTLFAEEGLNPGILDRGLGLLLQMGVIDSVSDPLPRLPDFVSLAEKALGERKETVRAMVRNRLLAWELDRRIRPCFNLLRVLHDLGGTCEDTLIFRALRDDINNGTCDEMAAAFSGKRFDNFTGKERVSVLKWIFNTQKALCLHTSKEIQKAFLEPAPDVPGQIFAGYRAQVEANLCAYRLGNRDIQAAAETVKELVLLNQNLRDGGIPAYRYFSFVDLYRHNISDALEYGSFAVDLAEKTGHPEELVKASYFAASAQFLYGNLSAAGRLVLKAEKNAIERGSTEWALRSRFFYGRLCFENGRYREALDIFASLEGRVPPEAERIIKLWIFRAHVYLAAGAGKTLKQDIRVVRQPSGFEQLPLDKPDFSFDDAGLFLLEAAFLSGNYEEAAALAGELLSGDSGAQDDEDSAGSEPEFTEDDFFYTEQPNWKSGFSQCELLLVPFKTLRNRLASVYGLLAESSLPDARGDSMRDRVHHMMRGELLPEGINGVFFSYALYRILRKTGAPAADTGTSLSRAYKRLQRRADRIDSKENRQDFVSLNYWNNALCLAAKENKLI